MSCLHPRIGIVHRRTACNTKPKLRRVPFSGAERESVADNAYWVGCVACVPLCLPRLRLWSPLRNRFAFQPWSLQSSLSSFVSMLCHHTVSRSRGMPCLAAIMSRHKMVHLRAYTYQSPPFSATRSYGNESGNAQGWALWAHDGSAWEKLVASQPQETEGTLCFGDIECENRFFSFFGIVAEGDSTVPFPSLLIKVVKLWPVYPGGMPVPLPRRICEWRCTLLSMLCIQAPQA